MLDLDAKKPHLREINSQMKACKRFYVLMKNEYADISNAITYPSKLILDNYTIINRDTNGLQFIKEVNFQGTGYIKRGDYTILYTPIVDINGLHVGFFVLVWSENLSLSSFK